MVVVHHCCQLGLGGKHITAPFYLCRHLGLFAITEYDMTALQSALKFYWLLRQVPRLQCVLQAGSLRRESRGPGFPHWGPVGRGRGLSRGCSPRAPRRKPGKELRGASLQVCVYVWEHPRLAGDSLPHASRGWARCPLHSALSLRCLPLGVGPQQFLLWEEPRVLCDRPRQASGWSLLFSSACVQTEGRKSGSSCGRIHVHPCSSLAL